MYEEIADEEVDAWLEQWFRFQYGFERLNPLCVSSHLAYSVER